MSGRISSDVGQYGIVPLWLIEKSSPRALQVYALLAAKYADRADQSANPRKGLLQADLRVESNRTIDAAIAELVSLGALTVERLYRSDGSPAPNRYRLYVVSGQAGQDRQFIAGQDRQLETGGPIKPKQTLRQPTAGHLLDSDPESSTRKRSARKPKRPTIDTVKADPLFQEFWRMYPDGPNKNGINPAADEWSKVVNANAKLGAIIVAVITVQRLWTKYTQDGGKYAPRPAKWLSEGRWQDEAPKTNYQRSNGNTYTDRPSANYDGLSLTEEDYFRIHPDERES